MDLKEFIDKAIDEDVREGDHTSLACVPPEKIAKAELISKEKGIIAGIEVARKVFQRIDADVSFDSMYHDGDWVEPGDLIILIKGKSQSILKAERLALNFMQRMSGIATLTNRFVKAVEGFPVKIIDTRKTTPLLRHFEKEAVRLGGGENHRMGLYDMIMIKDNHIEYSGGIRKAIRNVNDYLQKHHLQLKIEIEAASIPDVEEILSIGKVHRIMLDNFQPDDVRKAIKLINRKYETEISGGITLDNIRDYAGLGADYISVGALTHSVKSLDLSLKAI